ncbi:DUF2793 domain-containing protein [Brucella sp. HL-2]|nr:DUF2793 domain-containing protein [Brucella sp. HL-2]MCV9907185.1 DUF2793 domain-containing protein [Brucella sp. HL-2]
MDRVNGNNPADIGGGRRGFQSQNAAAGVAGTEVTAKYLNDVQEEICAVIENAGLVLDPNKQQQLWEALQSIAAPGFANRTPWLPVLSVTTTAPPNGAIQGDAYIVPAGATGAWAGHAQKIAEWTGTAWRIVVTKNGHGVSLPDGRVFERVGGVYVEKIAVDAQSGKWNFSVTGGSASALTATLSPAPPLLSDGMVVIIVPSLKPNAGATFNLNGLGAKAVFGGDGALIRFGDMMQGAPAMLVYSQQLNGWVLLTTPRLLSQIVGFKADTITGGVALATGVLTFVRPTNKIFDTTTGYSVATGEYTVSKAGVYSITANFYMESVDNITMLFICKNDTPVAESSSNSRGRVLSVSTLEQCAIGDKIRLAVRQSSGATMQTPTGTMQYSFAATLLGNI